MQGFEDVTFAWGGVEYTVPANRQLRLVAELEEILREDGLEALQVLMRKGGPGKAKLSEAASAAISYGGGSVPAERIYLAIQQGMLDQDNGALLSAQALLLGLISVVSPPAGHAMRAMTGEAGDTEKKDQAAG